MKLWPHGEVVVGHPVVRHLTFQHNVGAGGHREILRVGAQMVHSLVKKTGLPGVVIVVHHNKLAARLLQAEVRGSLHAMRDGIVHQREPLTELGPVAIQYS